MRRISAILFALLVCLCARALADTQPGERVELSETDIVIDLADGETYTLIGRVYPEGANQELGWYPSSRNLITVTDDGVITPVNTGSGWVTALIPGRGHIQAKCTVTVIDSRIATSVTISPEAVELEPTQSARLTAQILPETAPQDIIWRSMDAAVASVTQDGVVTAEGAGQTYVRAVCAQNGKLYAQTLIKSRFLAAPTGVTLGETTLNVKTGDVFTLNCTVTPEGASHILGYESSDARVATVNSEGVVNIVGYGRATITVRALSDTRVRAQVELTATDSRVPDRLVAYPSVLTLEPSQSRRVSVLALPQTASSDLVWQTSNPAIAQVDENGVVTALKQGKARITAYCAYTDKRYCSLDVSVEFGKTPTMLSLNITEALLNKGDTMPIEFDTGGADTSRAVVFSSSDESVAYVNEDGSLVAAGYGEAEITAQCLMRQNLTAKLNVKVEDIRYPLTLEADRDETQILLNAGEDLIANFKFTPATADTTIEWTTSNDTVISINEAGVPTAAGSGRALVTATSAYNPNLKYTYDVVVRSDKVQLEMPLRRTQPDGIPANLSRIESVRECALGVISAAREAGDMAREEAEKRAQIVNNAMDMYAFAWIVEAEQEYWSEENSEEGAKDFKPGTVYYGMPYISGSNTNRTFTFEAALESGYYMPVEGQQYYLFDKDRHPNGSYVGSDCSSFVALAYFGSTRYNGETVKTNTLFSDYRFRTFTDPEELMPGDILVKWGKHVVMFLYWANDSHTQIVVVEQGGNEPAINTVSTGIYELTHYTEDHYHMRAQRNFD